MLANQFVYPLCTTNQSTLLRIIYYLCGTQSYTLFSPTRLQLHVYSDACWAWTEALIVLSLPSL